jgi:hypothetical protein
VEGTNLGGVSGISNPVPPKLENESHDPTDTVPLSYQVDYDQAVKAALEAIPGLKIKGMAAGTGYYRFYVFFYDFPVFAILGTSGSGRCSYRSDGLAYLVCLYLQAKAGMQSITLPQKSCKKTAIPFLPETQTHK